MRKLRWFALVAALGCMGAWAQPTSSEPLRLVTALDLDRPIMVAERALLDTVFARAKLRYTLEGLPPERALKRFKDGAADGDANRNETFQQSHPQAIRVEPHVQNAYVYAVGQGGEHRPASWADLSRYSIAYVRGLKFIEVRSAVAATREVTDSMEACLKMAAARRVDWCIVPAERRGEWPGQAQMGGQLTGALIESVKLYLWLGPQHKAAAQQLGRVLRDMDQSGELQKAMGAFRAD